MSKTDKIAVWVDRDVHSRLTEIRDALPKKGKGPKINFNDAIHTLFQDSGDSRELDAWKFRVRELESELEGLRGDSAGILTREEALAGEQLLTKAMAGGDIRVLLQSRGVRSMWLKLRAIKDRLVKEEREAESKPQPYQPWKRTA